MFRFANNDFLYFLFIIPVIILLFGLNRYLRNRAVRRFGDPRIIMPLMDEVSKSRPVIKFIIILLAVISLIFGIAQPQFGAKLKEVKRRGIELVICLDVSNSMLSEDIRPNRLESAKLAITRLIGKLRDDKIGLIVFAGDAYVQLPITTDYEATEMFLESINEEIVPQQGTAIGAAIELAVKSFTATEDINKSIVIISDGENHEDNAVEAATKASEKGIIVHAIGMGLPQGAPIPMKGTNDFRRDQSGNIIVSKLDAGMLQQIATAGKGIFLQANNSSSALNTVFDEINKMEKKEIEAKVFADYDEKYQYLIGMCLFLLLFDMLVLERKNRLFRNIKLFGNGKKN